MLQRVFDCAEVRCRCVLRGPGLEPQPVGFIKISRTKVVFDWAHQVDEGTELQVDLKFPSGEKLSLVGAVAQAGEMGLFLNWIHPSDTHGARLQTLLVEAASLPKQAVDPEVQPEAPREDEQPNDVGAALLRRAKTVRSSDLAAARENVQVLDMGSIAKFIQAAVDEAVQNMEQVLSDDEKKRLLEEAEENFNSRLESFKAEKRGLQSKTKSLMSQLDNAQKLLEEERTRVVSADQFTVSNAGMEELEARLTRIIDRALQQGTADQKVADEMREIVAQLLDDERAKISERAKEAQSDALELLERKVSRLANALQETEKAKTRAERRAHALESAGGALRNVMDAGLEDDDPRKEAKLALLKEVIDANKKVRSQMKANGFKFPRAAGPGPQGPSTGGVKKITVADTKPPPLKKKSKAIAQD